jgi:hypothetical protein
MATTIMENTHSDAPHVSYAKMPMDISSVQAEGVSLVEHNKNICAVPWMSESDETSAMTPTRTQLTMALNGLGSARLDEPFRRAFGDHNLHRAMSGIAIKPGVFALMVELLEKRVGLGFHLLSHFLPLLIPKPRSFDSLSHAFQ